MENPVSRLQIELAIQIVALIAAVLSLIAAMVEAF